MNAVVQLSADPRSSIGDAPIEPGGGAGEDCRSSAEFEALEAEVRKIDTGGPKAVNWRSVQEQALAILRGRAKDYLVGAWCAYALYRCEGLTGLAVGFDVLRGAVDTHWDGAFPSARRERARVGCFDWLVGRLAAALPEIDLDNADPAVVAGLYESLTRFEDAVGAKLQKESFSATEIVRALRPHAERARHARDEARRRAEAEAEAAARAARPTPPPLPAKPLSAPPTPPPIPPAPASAPIVVPRAAAAPSAQASLADIETAIDALTSTIRAWGESLRKARPEDPRAYVLVRMGSWLRLADAPEAQNGRTMVFPPVEELQAIEAARTAKQWHEALALAEDLIWSAPYCADAQRASCEALQEMGPAFASAHGAALGMLRFFAERFSTALDMTFSDGRPFADDTTRALAAPGAGAAAVADEMRTALTQARALIGAGNAFEALDALAKPVRSATSGRQRMLWQIEQAKFCMQQGFVAAARPLLDYLDRLVTERGLEAWEPETAIAVAEMRAQALLNPAIAATLREDQRQVALDAARERLARLNIGAAARLQQG